MKLPFYADYIIMYRLKSSQLEAAGLKKKKIRKWPFVLLALVLAFAGILYDSSARIVAEEYVLEFDGLPENFDGFRIVQLSDLHEKVFGDGNSYLVSKVSEQRPDIITITGDMVDEAGLENYITNLVSELSQIAPVYYVTGNHEWATRDIEAIFDAVEEGGGTVLRNEYTILRRDGQEIVLAGIDDPNGPYDMKTPAELAAEVESETGDAFSLLLAHRNTPDVYSGLGFDLTLCGHAHGGIVRLPLIGALFGTDHRLFPDYTEGVYQIDGGYMLVSRGLGSGLPIPRFLNNPHIPVIVLKCK